jgi:hypothetical protein
MVAAVGTMVIAVDGSTASLDAPGSLRLRVQTSGSAPQLAPASAQLTGPRKLSPDECMRLLAGHNEGRLEYLGGRGPRGVMVRYALSEGEVEFRVADYNDIVHYARGESVVLVVEGRASAESAQHTIHVSGVAKVSSTGATTPDEEAQLDEAWPPGVVTTLLRLQITSVTGAAG